jgi:hypothetical protein
MRDNTQVSPKSVFSKSASSVCPRNFTKLPVHETSTKLLSTKLLSESICPESIRQHVHVLFAHDLISALARKGLLGGAVAKKSTYGASVEVEVEVLKITPQRRIAQVGHRRYYYLAYLIFKVSMTFWKRPTWILNIVERTSIY